MHFELCEFVWRESGSSNY